MARIDKTLVDLVTEGGELIRISCPGQFEDELYDSLNNTMRRGDWWSASQWDGCRAEYMGMQLDRVNMKKIVGML